MLDSIQPPAPPSPAATPPSPPAAPAPAAAWARSFFGAVVDPRSYRNLVFLLLAFPLGLVYFVFLVCGLSVGVGLTVIWIGLPLLALVLVTSRGMVLGERWLATTLLGADLPPAGPPVSAGAAADGVAGGERATGLWRRFVGMMKNPVTWKGIAYLLVKFPFSVVTFVITVTLVSLCGSLLAAPLLYKSIYIDAYPWFIDGPEAAFWAMAAGIVLTLVSLHALNGLAWLWRQLAVAMLGSRRFAGGAGDAGELPAAV
jgi:hypothetical protein